LGTSRGHVYYPCDLAEPGDPFLGGDVSYMGLTEEGKQVVFTKGIDRYVLDDDHLIMVRRMKNGELFLVRTMKAGEYLLIHVGHPGWGFLEALTIRILSDCF
jgi:hypothetical protein